MVSTANVETRGVQYLYGREDAFVFMDMQSYDQFTLDGEQVGDARSYLLENLELRAVSFDDRVIALELPMTVDLLVVETAPAIKGATAQAQLKPATVETGLQVLVPPYIESGERIRVDTRDGHFVERAR
jgi:elongation factor P